MIRSQWYVVLESDEVRKGAVGVTRLGEKMVFWRGEDGRVGAAIDRCPHRGAELGAGKVRAGNLQCPFHGFEFDPSGKCTLIPANGRQGVIPSAMRLTVYPTHEANGFIWIWWGSRPPDDLAVPPFFDDIDASFVWASARDLWNVHYSRVIENQLDVIHLPFIHRRTIGRGNRTLVDGPLVEWKGDSMFYTYVYNRVDDGRPPRAARELSPRPEGYQHLQFIFPNLWQNYINRRVRIVAAFVPVDEHHTLLYLRFYQAYNHLPFLGRIITKLAMPMNVIIAREDRRVVVTQKPGPSGLKIGEVLVQGDLPVIEYRRRRAAMQAEARES